MTTERNGSVPATPDFYLGYSWERERFDPADRDTLWVLSVCSAMEPGYYDEVYFDEIATLANLRAAGYDIVKVTPAP